MIHTFAICAYQESPYLEDCIRSLMRQSERTKVILCTSTPNLFIEQLTTKYKIPLFVRDGESDIQADWNFAYEQADTEYVTIAHQDDIYYKDYAKEMLSCFDKNPDTIIAMTDYKIVNEKNQARGDISLLVKQILKFPLRLPFCATKKNVKLAVQSLGNAICCPSVCYHKSLIQTEKAKQSAKEDTDLPLFQSEMKYALDWDTFYELAKLPGRFSYIPKMLFYYRMHEGTTTKKCLKDNRKTKEEIAMFSKFWPEWVVKVIMKGYKLSYRSYEE